MNCPNCKHKFDRPYLQCPNCKANIRLEDIRLTPLESKLFSAFNDNLFLIIAILTTATSLLSLASGGLPVISILISIFLWITYSNAKKCFVSRGSLRAISGTVYAEYLVNNKNAIFTVVMGFIIGILFTITSVNADTIIGFIEERVDIPFINLNQILSFCLKIPALFFIGSFIILAVSILIPNLLWRSKVHQFAKTLYKNLDSNTNPLEENPEIILKARNSIIILNSILITGEIISHSDVLSLISAASYCGAGVLTVILIHKYFPINTQNKE
jgi:hypothetical protein